MGPPVEERWAWVALAMVPGVGLGRYHGLLAAGRPAELFAMSRRDLAARAGEEVAKAIKGFDRGRAIGRQQAAAGRVGATLLTLEDAGYPPALRTIPQPPPFLFVRGALASEDALAIAIVGSRRPSAYGLRMAQRLAADLAARGVTVVSGFARGIDTAAHRGALEASGRTVAVLGSGADVIYPPENRRLVEAVTRQGAVVSEFPMGTPPLAQHFPRRNRVIAGMSLGTAVVEASEKSGALITAGYAGEFGREVFAVPGNVTSPVSEGTNRLIQDGAKLVKGWKDVVGELPEVWRRCLRPVAAAPRPVAEGAEGALLRLLSDEPVPIDTLIRSSGLSSGEVAALLVSLQLRGLVRQLPGQRYTQA